MGSYQETRVSPENRKTWISLGKALRHHTFSYRCEPKVLTCLALQGSKEGAKVYVIPVPLCVLLTIPRLELGCLAQAIDLLLKVPGLQL